jgi:uncharacterized protein (UPF0276 family)
MTGPRVSTTYEGQDHELLEVLLGRTHYLEVAPDALAAVGNDTVAVDPQKMAELRDVGSDAQIIVHGTGLSIGSYGGYNTDYIQLLDQFLDQVDIAWHSEHLGYTTVEGCFLGTMLGLPRTEEVLDMVCTRVEEVQRRYGVPFLLEHVVNLLPEPDSAFTEAGFLNAITSLTGCGLILDLYNLECDAHNRGLDIHGFLAEVDLEPVRELHLAGGVTHEGFALDVHSRQIAPSTLALAGTVLAAAANVQAVTYEYLRQSVATLGHNGIVEELDTVAGMIRASAP